MSKFDRKQQNYVNNFPSIIKKKKRLSSKHYTSLHKNLEQPHPLSKRNYNSVTHRKETINTARQSEMMENYIEDEEAR